MKQVWAKKHQTTITITLNNTFVDYADFAEKSGIDSDNVLYQNVFNMLYSLYGDTYTIENSRDYLANWLRFHIEQQCEWYEKTNEIWDTQIERLVGEYDEITQFRIGDLKEDAENYDKYKSSRQTTLKTKGNEILNTIKELQEMKTPIETLLNRLYDRLFMKVVVSRL